MERFKLKEKIEYIPVILSGIIFILQCSSWTSPLYPYAYGYDSSWYSMMGRAITMGKVPYRDYFDLKGPSLFFYEAFGQLFLKGRNGIFLIQCISIAFTVYFIWKAARLYLNRIASAVVLLFFYYVSYALIWGGNTVEELFMPFNMAAVFMVLDYIKNKENACVSPDRAALIMGVGFGVFLFSKVTVAAVICGSVITVVIMLIKDKDFKTLLSCGKYFLIGIVVVAVPLCIYFLVNGAFKEFIYCSFLFAAKRSTDFYETFSVDWELKLMICYTALFFGLCMRHENKEDDMRRLFLIIISVMQFLLLHLGTPYLYYFLSQMPVLVVMIIYYIHDTILRVKSGSFRPELRGAALLIAVLVVFNSYFDLTIDKFEENLMIGEEEWGKEQYFGCKEINDLVPEWERADIYNLESGMIYYEVNQTLPSNKYPVNLPYFLHLDPTIKTDVMNKLILHTPRWIISERMWEFDDDDVKEFVYGHYELVAENAGEELYRLKE